MKQPKRTIKRVVLMKVAPRRSDPGTFEEELEWYVDMLRYDVAFVNANYPGVIAFPVFHVKSQGTFGGQPTLGRWASFGYRPEPYEHSELEPMALVKDDPDGWFTFRTTDHVKTSLREYLESER